ncbi:MAG: site-2 protease family protein, partial [Candidatus Omnitrophica bacterium]|nr:site-2 protease family protein [Candidatus Omnitrophota bacterium]
GSIRLFKVAGISINVHITFFILLILFLGAGIKWLFVIMGVFFFVTLHELSHSLVARHFGITVKEITLLPIGGIASMTKMPEKPSEEFFISIAGPLLNIAVVLLLYFPMYAFVGPDILHGFFINGPSLLTWKHAIVYVYWINLILAAFNLIPAFPMDGGRILRSILANSMGYRKATRVAVSFGHVFALLFGYWGIVNRNFILIAIAVFIYMAASSEEMQVAVKETLRKFRVKDIISSNFLTLPKDATLSKVLELIFHSHQEDFPVIEGGKITGFVTRKDITNGIHEHGTSRVVSELMRTSFPVLRESDALDKAYNTMQENNIKALPVLRGEKVIGIVSLEDITRVYSVMAGRR